MVALKDGTTVQVKVGEDESDPVFYISDLLPHLAAKQNQKPLGNAIEGEQLNIWFGNIPYTAATEDDEKTVKNNVLHLLNDKYGITEADFMSAELSMVPAFKAKDVGFDRALLGSYGHDDRVCRTRSIGAVAFRTCEQSISSVFRPKRRMFAPIFLKISSSSRTSEISGTFSMRQTPSTSKLAGRIATAAFFAPEILT